MLRAVTFDFWNTLFVDPRGREREAVRGTILNEALQAAGLQPSEAALSESLRASWDFYNLVWLHEYRTPTSAELVGVILASLGARLPDEVTESLVTRFERLVLDIPPEPMPGAVYTLPEIATRFRLAVICDTGYSPGAVLRELLERHDMLSHFQYAYFSNEHGMSKPDRRVFLQVLRELHVPPGEAAHVGDIQRTDIAGAQSAGMAAVHFVAANDADVPHSTGDSIVRRFEDLPQALGSLICARC
jgi:FMN phosphatase YigB (HAD superfamily)